MAFNTRKEAVEFLATRIAEEASFSDVHLSEQERKLLFNLDDDAALSNGNSGDASETDQDAKEFIEKIAILSKGAYQRYRETTPDAARQWRQAVRVLKGNDHELGTIVYSPRGASDFGLLIVTALVVTALGLAVIGGLRWLDDRLHIQFSDTTSLVAVIGAFVVLYLLAWSKTAKRLGEGMMNSFGDAVDRVLRRF